MFCFVTFESNNAKAFHCPELRIQFIVRFYIHTHTNEMYRYIKRFCVVVHAFSVHILYNRKFVMLVANQSADYSICAALVFARIFCLRYITEVRKSNLKSLKSKFSCFDRASCIERWKIEACDKMQTWEYSENIGLLLIILSPIVHTSKWFFVDSIALRLSPYMRRFHFESKYIADRKQCSMTVAIKPHTTQNTATTNTRFIKCNGK